MPEIKESLQPKLYMLLLGSKAPNRNVEQHDFFFSIATSFKALIPKIKAFWPEAGNSIHIDGWREITAVDGYAIKVSLRTSDSNNSAKKLFFINLGGYQAGKLEEQHYTVLTVKSDRAEAVKDAKKTLFFKTNSLKGANSHVDEKYGIDVDEIYKLEDLISPEDKDHYQIEISPDPNLINDEIHLGYLKLDKI